MRVGEPRRKLEFALLATMVGVLALILIAVLESVRDDTEEAAVQGEAAALRVELLDVLSHREARGGHLPDSRNPVSWTGRAPVNYLGELDGAPAATGVWYFNRSEGVLAYRYRRGGEARFRLTVGAGGTNVPAALGGGGLIRLENAQ